MEKRKSRRCKIRQFSFLLSAFLVVAIFAITGNVRAYNAKVELQNVSQRALCNLDDSLSNIEMHLEKGIHSNSLPMLSKLAIQLSRETSGAKNSLAVLPISSAELKNAYTFLSQVGDFVFSLQKKLDMGIALTEKEREQLFTLLSYSKTLSEEISALRQQVFAGDVLFETKNKTLSVNREFKDTLHSGLEDTEQAFTDYESLIYDGPFSDHMVNRSAYFLAGKETISKEEAQQKASELLNVPKNTLQYMANEQDAEEAYRFYDGTTSIAITERGGYLLYMLSNAHAGEEKIGLEDAKKAAKAFLEKCGYQNMKDSYYVMHDGICTLNYAYQDGDYTCYTDLIKVSVSLENGSVLSMDCRGYILNHHERNLTKPTIKKEKALENLSPLLTVLDSKLAVIPTKSGKEKETYEFHCIDKSKQEYLVYINTKTGFEEDILLLLYEDNGVLTK